MGPVLVKIFHWDGSIFHPSGIYVFQDLEGSSVRLNETIHKEGISCTVISYSGFYNNRKGAISLGHEKLKFMLASPGVPAIWPRSGQNF